MRKALLCWLGLASFVSGAQAPVARPSFDAFDVATIKMPTEDEKGRFIQMQGTNRFVARDYTLKLLIAAAYELNPKTISGGPAWADTEHFDIAAVTPGAVRPTRGEQMKMLRSLLTERFALTFHREKREFSVYALELAKGGSKLKLNAQPEEPQSVGPGVVYPQKVVLPVRNASIGEFASVLQRAILDRPVLDRTGLTGRYDFDLEWAPDTSQFGGDVPAASDTAPSPPLFQAMQEQLGLRLEATRGVIDAMVVDAARKPSAN